MRIEGETIDLKRILGVRKVLIGGCFETITYPAGECFETMVGYLTRRRRWNTGVKLFEASLRGGWISKRQDVQIDVRV